ncbi:MAG: fasciclin domain-containing protein [Polyangiaceae bacterium]
MHDMTSHDHPLERRDRAHPLPTRGIETGRTRWGGRSTSGRSARDSHPETSILPEQGPRGTSHELSSRLRPIPIRHQSPPLHHDAFACVAACSSDPSSDSGGSDAGTVAPSDASSTDGATSRADIVDTAVAAGSFKTLVSAVQAAGLESTLRSAGPFTVFDGRRLRGVLLVPHREAPHASVQERTRVDPEVPRGRGPRAGGGGRARQDLGAGHGLGRKLSVDGNGGKVVVNGTSNVTTPDVAASNGVIHVVDGVLLPTIRDTASHYDDGTTTFKTLVTALTAGELAETLGGAGPFTVFAPSDAAFAKIPKATLDDLLLPANKSKLQAVLKLHVVSGNPVYGKDVAAGTVTSLGGPLTVTVTSGTVEVQSSGGTRAKVVLTDLPASNGVTHVLDTVLLPGT